MQDVWIPMPDKLVYLAHNLCILCCSACDYTIFKNIMMNIFFYIINVFKVGLITDDINNLWSITKMKNALYTAIRWHFPYTVYHLYFSNTTYPALVWRHQLVSQSVEHDSKNNLMKNITIGLCLAIFTLFYWLHKKMAKYKPIALFLDNFVGINVVWYVTEF